MVASAHLDRTRRKNLSRAGFGAHAQVITDDPELFRHSHETFSYEPCAMPLSVDRSTTVKSHERLPHQMAHDAPSPTGPDQRVRGWLRNRRVDRAVGRAVWVGLRAQCWPCARPPTMAQTAAGPSRPKPSPARPISMTGPRSAAALTLSKLQSDRLRRCRAARVAAKSWGAWCVISLCNLCLAAGDRAYSCSRLGPLCLTISMGHGLHPGCVYKANPEPL